MISDAKVVKLIEGRRKRLTRGPGGESIDEAEHFAVDRERTIVVRKRSSALIDAAVLGSRGQDASSRHPGYPQLDPPPSSARAPHLAPPLASVTQSRHWHVVARVGEGADDPPCLEGAVADSEQLERPTPPIASIPMLAPVSSNGR